ncbi:MAG: YkgJ family cysteine cluster protein [Promethearchaeota archaeon]|nr:MAG: YkgJ family cysteine cluster protein [Candidatus Lokiarchaeota archaeon]
MTTKEIKLSKTLENGIGFSCKMCGDCCRGFDEGEVYLYLDDVIKLADFLNFKGKSGLKKFAKKYLKIVDHTFYYKDPDSQMGKNYKIKALGFKFEGEDEHCHFLVGNKCTVHEARPFQCRCFPFWQMMVESRKNFVDYSKKCPGLKNSLENEGKYYSREEVINWAQKEYEMEEKYFLELKNNDFNINKVYDFLD